MVPFCFSVNGAAYENMAHGEFNGSAFYNAMRNGSTVSTSQINPKTYEDAFEEVLRLGKDLLFISMSSGISGSFGCARLAQAQLKEKYPDRKIYLIDSLGASLGEGLLVIAAPSLPIGKLLKNS